MFPPGFWLGKFCLFFMVYLLCFIVDTLIDNVYVNIPGGMETIKAY